MLISKLAHGVAEDGCPDILFYPAGTFYKGFR